MPNTDHDPRTEPLPIDFKTEKLEDGREMLKARLVFFSECILPTGEANDDATESSKQHCRELIQTVINETAEKPLRLKLIEDYVNNLPPHMHREELPSWLRQIFATTD